MYLYTSVEYLQTFVSCLTHHFIKFLKLRELVNFNFKYYQVVFTTVIYCVELAHFFNNIQIGN